MTRLFLALSAAFALSGCAALSLLGYHALPNYPDDAATDWVRLEGLGREATIVFDAQGVPHVYAASLEDLARATGYAQGRSRFFQMDMLRRLARGRTSELVGVQPLLSETTLDYDRTMRGWEIERRAMADFSRMPAEDAAVLRAFADGVNAAMRERTPVEYRLLALTPEPWEPTDSLAIGVLNVWSVSHNWTQEATRLVLALNVGVERASLIYPHLPPPTGRSLAAKEPRAQLPPAVVQEVIDLFPPRVPTHARRGLQLWSPGEGALAGLGLDAAAMGGASNAWVVDGTRTASGKPMVANDPHLTHLLPSIFVQLHLVAPGLDVIGATLPGLPYVITGHNQRVAWGVTSTVADAMDFVIEKEDPARPGLVLHPGGTCRLEERTEILRAREQGRLTEHRVTLRKSCNGPLFNDLHPHLLPPGAPLVAIRWRTAEVEKSIGALRAVNQAQSVDDLGDKVAAMPSAYSTWTAADVDGNVGVFLSGEVPVRPNHLGTFAVPGWVDKYEWTRFARGRALPFGVNVPGGVIAHANNLMRDPSSADGALTHVDAAPGWRHDRIRQLLEATPRHTPDSFRRVFSDVHSLRAAAIAPHLVADLKAAPGLSPRAGAALELLAGWDDEADAKRAAPAIFFLTWKNAIALAVDDEMSPEGVRFFLAQRYSTNVADDWFQRPDHPVWDDVATPQKETRPALVVRAFEAAVSELARTQGNDLSRWRWGALHQMRPMHAFGSRDALDGFNLEGFEAGGELDSVWKSHFDLGNARAPFKVVAGPAYRSVVDLANLSEGQWVIDTGTSGWPLSPHWGDQYQKWRRGELVPMQTSPSPVGRLVLKP
jgi:penicillin G amidase